MRPVEVICFDGDQTLWDFWASMWAGLTDALVLLRRRLPDVGPVTVDYLIADRERVAAAMPDGSVAAIPRAAFEHSLERLEVTDTATGGLADELCAHYMQRRRAALVAYPDVQPALRRLHGRYRLALLSNGNTHPREAGLAEFFDVLLYADDVGLRKPDPAIFAELAQQCGCESTRMVMVGDSLDHDVMGAMSAGWRAIWLNRDGAVCPPSVRPDGIVSALTEVDGVLAEIGCVDAWIQP